SFPEFSSSALLLWLGVGVMLAFCAAMGIALFVPAFVGLARKFSFLPFVLQGCDFLESLQRNRRGVARVFPQIIAISLAVFFLKGIEWYLFGLALGIGFSVPAHPFLVFLLLQPLITVFQFAPFPTIAGIGISEGSAVASMSLLGVPVELAVAYTLLVRAGTTMLDLIGIRQAASFVLPKG
ncbi:MAG: lysylphosphatidylglycerol synthase domain-containing protein, partial [Bacteroidota bacterium]